MGGMHVMDERERATYQALCAQLDKQIARDRGPKKKEDRREHSAPVSIERRSGIERRKGN